MQAKDLEEFKINRNSSNVEVFKYAFLLFKNDFFNRAQFLNIIKCLKLHMHSIALRELKKPKSIINLKKIMFLTTNDGLFKEARHFDEIFNKRFLKSDDELIAEIKHFKVYSFVGNLIITDKDNKTLAEIYEKLIKQNDNKHLCFLKAFIKIEFLTDEQIKAIKNLIESPKEQIDIFFNNNCCALKYIYEELDSDVTYKIKANKLGVDEHGIPLNEVANLEENEEEDDNKNYDEF